MSLDIPTQGSQIHVRDVTRIYHVGRSDVHALRGVSLDVAPGEIVGIAGVSGSGKSTLLQLMGGLDRPTSGEIHIRGQDLGALNSYERSVYRRESVGFVFQSFYLNSHLSAVANVRLALTLQGTYGAARKRLASEALDRVGLSARAAHRPGQLSCGEQQRVTVARAIVHQPPLLLADEPTANLDRETATGMLDLLSDLHRESNMTVVIVTHDVDLVSQYCDRMIHMRDGQIDEQGDGS